MKPKILVTRKLSDGAEEKLKKNFDVTLNLDDEPISNEKLIELANEFDGFISTGFDKIGKEFFEDLNGCLLYTSPSPRDATLSRMPSSA